MTSVILPKNKDETVLIDDTFLVTNMPMPEYQGSQGLGIPVIDTSLDNIPRFLKIFGVDEIINTKEYLQLNISDTKKIIESMAYEKKAYSMISKNYPRFPLINSARTNKEGLSYIVMTYSKENTLKSHNVFNLEHVIQKSPGSNDLQKANIEMLNNRPWYEWIKDFIYVSESVGPVLHREHSMVHNDLKPSQIVYIINKIRLDKIGHKKYENFRILKMSSGELYEIIVQLVDFGSRILINDIRAQDKEFFLSNILNVTTIMYNHPDTIDGYIELISNPENTDYVAQKARDLMQNKAALFKRDGYALKIILYEILTGKHPYSDYIQAIFEENEMKNYGKTIYTNQIEKNKILILQKISEKAREFSNNAKEFYKIHEGKNSESIFSKMPKNVREAVFSFDENDIYNSTERLWRIIPENAKKIKRKEFIKYLGTIVGAAGIISAAEIGQDLFKSAKMESLELIFPNPKIDVATLKSFRNKILEERILPAIERTAHDKNPNDRCHVLPHQILNGAIYERVSDKSLESGHFIKLVARTIDALNISELKHFYTELILSRQFEFDESGYRISRIRDSVNDFLKNFTNLSTQSKEKDAINNSRLLMQKYHELITTKFLTRTVPYSNTTYFKANPEDDKLALTHGANHVIRAESYFIVKDLIETYPELFDNHMKIMSKYLIENGFVHDRVYFGGGIVPIVGTERPIKRTLNQVMIIDLLSDWNKHLGEGKQLLDLTISKYEENLSKENFVSTEYTDLDKISQQIINHENNLPDTLYIKSRLAHHEITFEKEAQDMMLRLIKRIDTSFFPKLSIQEGLVPNFELEPKYFSTYNIMSDCLAIEAINNYLLNEKKYLKK
ncbi:MAG: hypothetical protein ACP5NV_03880 [Candidatus Woesearchaeota archaeon]